jgi:hypothetical protein
MNISVRSLQSYEQGQRDFAGAKLNTILMACRTLKCGLKEMFEDDAELLNLIKNYEKQQ